MRIANMNDVDWFYRLAHGLDYNPLTAGQPAANPNFDRQTTR